MAIDNKPPESYSLVDFQNALQTLKTAEKGAPVVLIYGNSVEAKDVATVALALASIGANIPDEMVSVSVGLHTQYHMC